MELKKRGLIFIVLVVVLTLLFQVNSALADPNDVGYCYEISTSSECSIFNTQAECENPAPPQDPAEFDPSAQYGLDGIHTTTNPNICTTGCCCYQDPAKPDDPDAILSQVVSQGYCAYLQGDETKEAQNQPVSSTFFDASIKTELECSAFCAQLEENIEQVTNPHCSDGLDNDGDGLLDLEDPGCTDAEDNDELDPQACAANSLLTEECLCGPEDALQTCTAGQYCQFGECVTDFSQVAGTCTPGSIIVSQAPALDVCQTGTAQTVYKCNEAGEYKLQEPQCPPNPEICDKPGDEDGDGLADCADSDCAGQVCYDDAKTYEFPGIEITSEQNSACYVNGQDYSQDLLYDGVSQCCADGQPVVQCGANPPQCGECSCELSESPNLPSLKLAQNQAGQQSVVLKITSTCPVPLEIQKYESKDASCQDENGIENIACHKEKFNEQLFVSASYEGYEKNKINHFEEIIPERVYCFRIKANYQNVPGDAVYSSVECIETGHAICLNLPKEENKQFCYTYGFDNDLESFMKTQDNKDPVSLEKGVVYQCDENNQLVQAQKCAQTEICVETPGGAECVEQSPCIFCGVPFNMFADKQTSVLEVEQGLFSSTQNQLCKNEPLCYYDYTSTSKDAFDECQYINSCYDYKSQEACEQNQGSITGSNNKCLARECNWKPTNDKLNLGVCEEIQEDYQACEFCNSAEHNEIFNDCNVDRCLDFSNAKGMCYIQSDTQMCRPEKEIGCEDYKSQTECTGWDGDIVPLKIDVDYDENYLAIAGTNKITQKSNDRLGFGVCRWSEDSENKQNSHCYKDANFDASPDPIHKDVIPPVTTLLSPTEVSIFNLSFARSDPTEKGRIASGANPDSLETYYCVEQYVKDKPTNEKCYPNILYKESKELEKQHGEHLLRYYSKDPAQNLEEIKEAVINIDREKPVIQIDVASQSLQYPDDLESGHLTIKVTLVNEDLATCTDSLESKEFSALDNDPVAGTAYPEYFNLKDGMYLYTIECTDPLGNTGEAHKIIHVDNDPKIQLPEPNGVLDYTPIELSFLTQNDLSCELQHNGATISVTNKEQFIPDQNSPETFYLQKASIDLTKDDVGTHEFKIYCDLGSGKTAYDEIQFVYDVEAPTTNIVTASGDAFDTQKWYKGEEVEESLFFKCDDNPEYGFGCAQIMYCIDNAQCTPDKEYNEINPVDTTLSDPLDDPWVCFNSIENTQPHPELAAEVMGGREEPIKCIRITTDTTPPIVATKYKVGDETPSLNKHEFTQIQNSGKSVEEGAKLWPLPSFDIIVKITDTDALGDNNPINTLDVYVIDMQSVANTALPQDAQVGDDETQSFSSEPVQSFTDLNANEQVDLTLNLVKGLNEIKVVATDRSGMTTTKKYYVKASDLPPDVIELIKPSQGVSEEAPFTLQVGIIDDFPLTADECKIIDEEGQEFDLQKIAGGKKFEALIDGKSNGVPFTVEVTCLFANGEFTTKAFQLVYDTTPPEIITLQMDPHNNYDPATLIDSPIEGTLTALTDDKTRCKLSRVEGKSYAEMTPFESYQSPISSLLDLTTTNTQTLSESQTDSVLKIEDKKQYTYYVRCDNGLVSDGHVSAEQSIDFNVDTSLQTDIEIISPPLYTSETSFPFTIKTKKEAEICTWSQDEQNLAANTFTTTNGLDFDGGTITVPTDGKYTLWIECLFTGNPDPQIRSVDVVVDTTPPTFESFTTDNITSTTKELSAQWKFVDNASGIKQYEYSVGSTKHGEEIKELTITSSATVTVDDLKLTNGSTYYWNVKAQNRAGLWSGEFTSAGTLVDTSSSKKSYIPSPVIIDTCFNGILDDDETDVDCGGTCGDCINEQACQSDFDCASGTCDSGVCIQASCYDFVLNRDETDIDCGGSLCPSCGIDQQCDNHADCDSNYCNLGVCKQASCTDGIQNGNENGIDCGGTCVACEFTDYEGPEQGEVDLSPQEEEPKSNWLLYLMIFIFLLLAAGAGYYYYTTIYLPQHQPNRPKQEPIYKPLQRKIVAPIKRVLQKRTLSDEEKAKIRAQKAKQRESLLSTFESQEKQEKESKQKQSEPKEKKDRPKESAKKKQKNPKKSSKKKLTTKKKSSDPFKDLEDLTKGEKDEGLEELHEFSKHKSTDDPFKELEKIKKKGKKK